MLGRYWATGQIWTNTGRIVINIWSDSGQILVKYWSNTGQILVKPWSNAGQDLVGYWSSTGHGLVKSAEQLAMAQARRPADGGRADPTAGERVSICGAISNISSGYWHRPLQTVGAPTLPPAGPAVPPVGIIRQQGRAARRAARRGVSIPSMSSPPPPPHPGGRAGHAPASPPWRTPSAPVRHGR